MDGYDSMFKQKNPGHELVDIGRAQQGRCNKIIDTSKRDWRVKVPQEDYQLDGALAMDCLG